MGHYQAVTRWLQKQPLFLLINNRAALAGRDKESTFTLIGAPILAVALVLSGSLGAGATVAPTTEPAEPTITQASDILEPAAATAEPPEAITAESDPIEVGSDPIEVGSDPVEVGSDPVEAAIALWGTPDLAAILTEEFPGAEWSLNGNSYSGLTWLSPGAKPTEAELLNLWGKVAERLAERQLLADIAAEKEAAEQQAAANARAADPTRQDLCNAIDYKALYGPGVDYTKVLSVHYPGAQWSLNGSAYSGLTWLSPGSKPTQATLDSLWDGVAFQLCLQKPLSELTARAGTSETEEYVEGALRPKGYSDGTFTPTLANCNLLPHLPHDTHLGGSAQVPAGEEYVPPPGFGAIKSGSGWGSRTGDYDVYTYGIELPKGLSATGVDLGKLGCLIAEAHGYWGNQYSIGLSLSGDTILHIYNTQVDRDILDSVLRQIGAL